MTCDTLSERSLPVISIVFPLLFFRHFPDESGPTWMTREPGLDDQIAAHLMTPECRSSRGKVGPFPVSLTVQLMLRLHDRGQVA